MACGPAGWEPGGLSGGRGSCVSENLFGSLCPRPDESARILLLHKACLKSPLRILIGASEFSLALILCGDPGLDRTGFQLGRTFETLKALPSCQEKHGK